jgi:isocitrate dehydrogenase kinase/phosphatase
MLFGTKGIDPYLEFLAPPSDHPGVEPEAATRQYLVHDDLVGALDAIVRDCRFHASWFDLTSDLERAAERLPAGVDVLEVADTVFFRGKGAYVVGRLLRGNRRTPFAIAIRHERTGLRIAAVMVGEADLAVLFSYTRSAFLVACDRPSATVAFIAELLPMRKASEIYASIGFRKQAKTERYRELTAHLRTTDELFAEAPGVPGLVMIVFTMPSHDLVFKVIRDRFPPQKQVTPADVAERYRIVSRHDRAGRLVEAQRFVDLRLPALAFTPDLLRQLAKEASRTVLVAGGQVTISTVYVERKVTPLDIHLRSAPMAEAERAILDYGAAIKNLAASNIFPGDMLLKNFGVTGRGRVVFYDYDEIGMLTDYHFRRFPEPADPMDDLADTPAFGVGPNDVFPEELVRFLGLSPHLRSTFEQHHRDLFEPDFWQSVQARLENGERIEILPYRRSRSLEPS